MSRFIEKPSLEYVQAVTALRALSETQEPGRAYADAMAERILARFKDAYCVHEARGYICCARLRTRVCPHAQNGDDYNPDKILHRPPCTDHASLWMRGKEPVLYVSQPYTWHLNGSDIEQIAAFCRRWEFYWQLNAELSWHFAGKTILIAIWRSQQDAQWRRDGK